MLLTSGQVSVAISSVIIFLFTTALFLAGYVLQQQTVRDIRAVIKPQIARSPGGQDLTTRFRDDGYLVDVIVDPVMPPKEELRKRETTVEVKTTPKENAEELDGRVSEGSSSEDGGEDDMIGATRWQKAARRKQLEAAKAQKVIEEASNTKSSRMDKQKLEAEKEQQKISAAERRRKIKEQIIADGQGESFKGYRRRMW